MTINYDFYKNPATDSDDYHVRLIENSTATSDELAERIQHGTTLTTHDMKAALSALSDAIVDNLLAGHSVHLDGLGYFHLSVEGRVERDAKGELQLKDYDVRGLTFRPEKAVVARLKNARLTRKNHRGRHSKSLDDEELAARIDRHFAANATLTFADFVRLTGLTTSTARRRLAALVEGGQLRKTGTQHLHLYTRP